MEIDFFFILLVIGTLIASLQDFKRREIDRWLTYSLLIGGIFHVIVNFFITNNTGYLIQGVYVFVVCFLLSNLLYYSKFFAGGDANLLFSMSAFFIGQNFFISTLNIFSFLILLFISGSIYGIVYSTVLYFKNFKNMNIELKKNYRNSKIKFLMLVSIPFFVLFIFYRIFLAIGIVLFLFPNLIIFAKTLESIALEKKISTKDLRIGDWIKNDIVVDNKVIKSSFYGVTEEDVKLLQKEKENVIVKDGLPFAPVFFIAVLSSIFFLEKIISFIFNLF